ncbi:transcriptional regulator GcvA [Dongia deserti]|uniref:transcriptional regulator GcvA n=1 Tax=Dongia deserti TaxID=2268030 RepID=UPI000E64F24D|nr:transcriptional regulator GcvA [Dongia deserti]
MIARLPSLSAFSTFEAAARHQSFTRAAEELRVTPAAVSYVVRELEAQLKVKLFHRTKRAVRLTQAGEILNVTVSSAIESIGHALERVRSLDGHPVVKVTTTPGIAMKWLVPRLNGFLEKFPDVDVRVDMSHRPVDLMREDMDIAIRFGTGQYPGLQVERLLSDKIFPICSPKMLKGPRPLRHPRDLRHFTLIHVDWQAQGATWPTWQMWMTAAGITGIDTTRGIHFDQGVMAIQAAIDGQGVALGDSSLTGTDLAQGRLVRPFALALDAPARFAYWIVVPPHTAERPLVNAFRDWLRSEAAMMEQAKPKPSDRQRAQRSG